ncbi:MAG: chromate transporter [Methylocystis sp.]|nr:MAG: chromate transporter [Methylocystis sp.]
MNAPVRVQGADHGVSLREALGVWGRIALLSFGGPAGQIALMHKVLVDEKRWLSESRFLHALNYCMLLPGPEAQQLATYVGWLMHGTLGGVVAGGLFVLPGAAAIMALSIVYALFGKVGFVAAAFFGLKAAVLAIVVQAAIRVGKRALRNRPLQALAVAAFVAIFLFGAPFPLIVLAAGIVGYFCGKAQLTQFAGVGHGAANSTDDESLLGETLPGHTRPSAAHTLRVAGVWLLLWLAPVAALRLALGPANVISQIAVFFSKMAMVTFGGAYAVLAYVAQQAVDNFHWLNSREMLDGLGMAETTPGPLVIVLQFVGFLAAYRDPGSLPPVVAGALGGLLTTWVTFAPCFLWIFLGAPFVEKLRGDKALAGALMAITAAVVGVILNLAIWFSIHVLFREIDAINALGLSVELPAPASVDPIALALTIVAALALFRFDLGVPRTLAFCTGAGIFLYFLGATPASAQNLSTSPLSPIAVDYSLMPKVLLSFAALWHTLATGARRCILLGAARRICGGPCRLHLRDISLRERPREFRLQRRRRRAPLTRGA